MATYDREISPDVEADSSLFDVEDFESPSLTRDTYLGGNQSSNSRQASNNNEFAHLTGEQSQDRRFTGGDTLDEPISVTLLRDVKAVGRRVLFVLWPKLERYDQEAAQNTKALKEWDLWGPLIFCLFLALFLSLSAPATQSSLVFSGVFTMVWFGEGVATLNIKLLGGTMPFFRALSILGYSLFPIVIASFLSIFVHTPVIRIPVDAVLVAWSLYASIYALSGSGVPQNKVFLSTYPVGLFFFIFGWLCVIT